MRRPACVRWVARGCMLLGVAVCALALALALGCLTLATWLLIYG